METDIIEIARQLLQQGKKPTVALIKGRLTQSVPLPVIISVLQKIQGLGVEQVSQMLPPTIAASPSDPAQQSTRELSLQVTQLSIELKEVKQQLTTLQRQFSQLQSPSKQS